MAQNTYDETPYPASAFAQTHPVKLATIGKLFGVEPTPIDRCRVLELGCADGSNLLPLAQSYPNSQFDGVDYSSVQVDAGQKILAGSGLKNVTLTHQNIADFTTDGRKYDYIIVHGIFSWVPVPIREKILQICQESLSEQGIAYVSYNAFPGWHMRGMLRDMMLFHVKQFTDVNQRIAQARALLKFLSESVPTENSAYGLFLKAEVEGMKNWSDSYLRHEWLEETNQPFYFHEFVELAGKFSLQYLGETELSSMLASNYPPNVQEGLARVGTNIVAMEQYMDFLRNRMFRQTLLVRQDLKLNRNIQSASIRDHWFTTHLRPTSAEPNIAAGQKEEFKAPNGAAITTDNALVKTVLLALARANPNQVSFVDLIRDVRINLLGNTAVIRDPDTDRKEEAFVAQQILGFYTRGLVEMTTFPYPSAGMAGERPRASGLARYQALNCRSVTSLRHISLPLDFFSRHLLSLLDGERDREALLAGMIDKVQTGVLNVQHNGGTIKDPELLRKLLEPRIATVLSEMALIGVLVPA